MLSLHLSFAPYLSKFGVFWEYLQNESNLEIFSFFPMNRFKQFHNTQWNKLDELRRMHNDLMNQVSEGKIVC